MEQMKGHARGKAGEDGPDFGTNKKQLGPYFIGLALCIILTLIAFGTVMSNALPQWQIFTLIYGAAIIQFFVQLICFLRLQVHTEQGKNNVVAFIFTGVVLMTIVIGSLWIMWNVNYNMMFM
jgi:cytochrome o ubiquinol oxidase operon protein cyoD